MTRSLLSAILALAALFGALPARAESWTVVYEEEWVEQVPASASRFVSPLQAQVEHEAVASYGPFRVIDEHTAALVGTTDSRSPAQLAAMLAAWPQIERLDFVEAPGTVDDLANLKMGRLLRARGISTSVSSGGSVRSGAVELFLAGARRTIAPGAEFAVHGWLDYDGRGAEDYPPGSPEHQRYLDYYTDMGMTREEASRFYAMTNSVPFEDALWLDGVEMARWMGQEVVDRPATMLASGDVPHIVYLDLGALVQ
ncbi:alpha/beta hydrolase [Aurantiacibacter flavus]|uniref:Alpha/beta hydrolase n=1 Tax=Aurantiacibacter flavus TaxID=3145232 RepID=A0ABV0D0B6_9SPHN